LIEKWFQYFKGRGEEEAGSFTGALVRVLMKIVFVLEPLIPFFVRYFLNRQLKSWKQMNLIVSPSVRIERTARFCYKIDVHFVLTTPQLENVLNELLNSLATSLAK
jgi:hypothetical protein